MLCVATVAHLIVQVEKYLQAFGLDMENAERAPRQSVVEKVAYIFFHRFIVVKECGLYNVFHYRIGYLVIQSGIILFVKVLVEDDAWVFAEISAAGGIYGFAVGRF